MKKWMYTVAAAALLLSACNEETKVAGTKDNDVAATNLHAARRIANAFGTGDLTAIDSFVADNFLDHTQFGDKVGKDSLKALIEHVRKDFSSMKMEPVREVADDEYVFQWLRYSGTSNGSDGMAPGPYSFTGIEVSRFSNGKAVEHWGFMEMAEMMKMMGGGQSAPADTTKVK